MANLMAENLPEYIKKWLEEKGGKPVDKFDVAKFYEHLKSGLSPSDLEHSVPTLHGIDEIDLGSFRLSYPSWMTSQLRIHHHQTRQEEMEKATYSGSRKKRPLSNPCYMVLIDGLYVSRVKIERSDIEIDCTMDKNCAIVYPNAREAGALKRDLIQNFNFNAGRITYEGCEIDQ